MLNLVEMIGDEEQYPSPCKYGNIVKHHACYCHSSERDAPRKCPIWRHFGDDPKYWKSGSWDDNACPFFNPAEV
jgi:hypothetical protein